MFRLTAAVFLALVRFSAASPGGAPVCPADESAPGAPHRGAGFIEESIEEGNLNVTINGEPIVVGTPVELFTGETYEVTISTATFFRGLLARLAGGDAGVDTLGLLSVAEGDINFAVSSACTAEGVAGVTHQNRVDKTSATFFMALDEPSTNMPLDLNVVEVNSDADGSVFYYDQFLINAVAPPTEPPTSAPTMAPLVSIYETGVAANLTVADLAASVGLDGALSDPNATLTLMAPVNEAFAALPPRIVQYLMNNTAVLTGVLLGHVLPVEAPASFVVTLDGTDVTFLNGVSQTVSVTDGAVSITAGGEFFDGSAQVVQTDIFASNGVIHLIDRILGLPTLLEVVQEGGAALVAAFTSSGLASTVETLNGVTLFAPTTTGFLTLSAQYPELAQAVLANSGWVLHVRALLLAHVAPVAVFSEDLEDDMMVTMVSGDNFTINIGNNVTTLSPGSVNGVATVVEPFDVLTTQGVVHTIDALLIPGFLGRTVVDIAVAETSTLASLVVRAGLDGTLATTFGLTVFAPNDAAFAKLDDATLTLLQSDDGMDTLTDILRYHVLPAGTVVPSVQVATGSVPTLLGPSIDIDVSDAGVVLNGESTVVVTDALANNGIVHIIDTVLTIPPVEIAPTMSPTMDSSSALMASGVFAYVVAAVFWALI
eukprot:scaffold575_cov186-Amphora_coffeaeformis.AAC.19